MRDGKMAGVMDGGEDIEGIGCSTSAKGHPLIGSSTARAYKAERSRATSGHLHVINCSL